MPPWTQPPPQARSAPPAHCARRLAARSRGACSTEDRGKAADTLTTDADPPVAAALSASLRSCASPVIDTLSVPGDGGGGTRRAGPEGFAPPRAGPVRPPERVSFRWSRVSFRWVIGGK